MNKTPTSTLILASDVQPGDVIHRPGWAATTGWYEVRAIEPLASGVYIALWFTKPSGGGFEMRFFYTAGKTVEIVAR